QGITARSLYPRLKDATFDQVRRRGKFLFARLGDRGWLVLHFGMTGQLQSYQDDQPEYTRLVLEFREGHNLAVISRRMLGRVSWTDDVEAFIKAEDLGPDVLDDDLDSDRFAGMLSDRTGAIKSTLMDQSIIAGIGNVYADEICYQASLRPDASLADVDRQQLGRLYRVMRRVLRTAARHGGDADELPDHYLLPNRREGESCSVCGGKFRKMQVTGRTTIYCPDCQHEP
ncbi:MAG: DNA-formamidopyrimidine glycosylase family protein, partial [Planctomycetota bacterium]